MKKLFYIILILCAPVWATDNLLNLVGQDSAAIMGNVVDGATDANAQYLENYIGSTLRRIISRIDEYKFVNDYASIQSQISANGTATFNVGDTLSITNSQLSLPSRFALIGTKNTNYLIQTKTHVDSSNAVIDITDAEYVMIDGLTIDGNVADNSYYTEFDMGVSIINSKNVILRNLKIKNCSGDGLYINDSENIIVENCDFENWNVNGSPLRGRNGAAVVADNGDTTKTVYFINCNFSGGSPAAVDVEPNAGGTVQDILIQGCQFNGSSYTDTCNVGFEIYVGATAHVEDVKVSDTIIRGYNKGVWINGNASADSTHKNIILDNVTATGCYDYGFYILQSYGVRLFNCQAIDNDGDGINVQPNVKGLIIRNFTAVGNHDGMYFYGTSDNDIFNTIIDGCNVYNNTRYGLYAQVLKWFRITNSSFYDDQVSQEVTNGTFESTFSGGLATGWAEYGVGQTSTQETITVHGGSNAQKRTCANDANDMGIAQASISVTSGNSYKVYAWVYLNSERDVTLRHDGLIDNTKSITVPATTWTRLEWEVDADATIVDWFYIYNSSTECTTSDYIIIDDVQFLEVSPTQTHGINLNTCQEGWIDNCYEYGNSTSNTLYQYGCTNVEEGANYCKDVAEYKYGLRNPEIILPGATDYLTVMADSATSSNGVIASFNNYRTSATYSQFNFNQNELRFYNPVGNYVGLKANTYDSRVSTGTAPLSVLSTTKVTNLNADYLDGHDTSYFATPTNILIPTGETITATSEGVAASLTKTTTIIDTNDDGDTDTVTLADGTIYQIKHFTIKSVDALGATEIVPANMAGGQTKITFSNVNDGCTMIFDGTSWCVIANNGGTIS